MRSLASGWSKGSVVAVDAGVHLGAIANILENTQPPSLGHTDDLSLPHRLATGPFAGLEVPHATASANAAHIHRSLIDTYLITHPHLDHIAGFVINTAGLPGSRPKRLAGLPSTIAAFKTHIFNNVIWPNLSDENNGAGLVTYMRLVEGGSPALGEGEGRGYLEICDGLSVKIWGVSHGHCIERHSHRGSGSSARHGSFDASSMGPMGVGMGLSSNPLMSPRALAHHNSANTSLGSFLQQQQQQREQGGGGSQAGAPSGGGRASSISGGHSAGESVCVYDSSAYFIRDVATGREVLIFGDVEPDSISLSPRNQQIWQEAAPKIAAGKLAGIFIECSYDDSQSIDRLFGHLTPRFIAEEMTVLAAEVSAARLAMQQEKHVSTPMDRSQSTGHGSDKKKRKRDSTDDQLLLSRRKAATPTPHGGMSTPSRSSTTSYPVHLTPNTTFFPEDPVSPKTVKPTSHVPPRRVGSGTTSTSTFSGHGSLHSDDLTNSTNSTSTGAMGSALNKTGAGSYFDSPHLATPTAELTLHDLGDLSAAGPATPLSLNNGGSLPPSIMQMPASTFHHEPSPMSMPSIMDAPTEVDGVLPADDYDVSMGLIPQSEVEEGESVGCNGHHSVGEMDKGKLVELLPLRGLKVVIIHVKDKLNDGPRAGDVILQELVEHERELRLGCEFLVSEAGQDLYL